MIRRLLTWLVVWGLAGGLAVLTTVQSIGRYREFRSAWPWDFAYNNQWFWSLLFGDGYVSVYPVNFWALEGPSVWVKTHLDPIRLLILPIYALVPGPETLIAVQNVILWWTVPAAFGLVRSESGSTRLGLLAALLVPLTPQLWPLAWNDFREMELAIPFVLWAIQGYRDRRAGLTAFGIAGMLACREEYALVVACLAILPPRRPEEIGRTYRWSRGMVALGVGWMLLVYFAFESVSVSHLVPWSYMGQFGVTSTPPADRAASALGLFVLGLGTWSLLAIPAPRLAILALFWILEAARDRWTMGMLATSSWHYVRFTAPAVALALAAGLVGFARVGSWVLRRRGGRLALAGLWAAIAAGLLAARFEVVSRVDGVAGPIPAAEARAIRSWIGQVAADDGVLAAYEVSVPLSSRRYLYSDVMDINRPPGFPRLAPEIRWVFLPPGRLAPQILVSQGFEVVYPGESLWVYHRSAATGGPTLTLPTLLPTDFHRPNPLIAALPALVPALALALGAWIRLGPIRRRPSPTAPAPAITGGEAAAAILGASGVEGVAIVPAPGPLADFYDPARRELRLSPKAFEGRSAAALAVAAHEAGQAMLSRRVAALRTLLVFAAAWASTAGWIAVASGLIFVTARLALWGSLLVAGSALAGLALLPIGLAANRSARRALAGAGLGGIESSPGFARALSALPLAPLTAVGPFGRRFRAVPPPSSS